jgi:tryptophan synthase alpha chain
MLNGSNRIESVLNALRETGEPAVVPFVTVGFPDVESSIDVVQSVVEMGADMVELGVPFSDPLAEGPTIQKTSQHALERGVTLDTCLDAARELRARGVEAPLIPMGYYNPFLRRGLETFAEDAARAGVNGLIVPDLPAEESDSFRVILRRHGISLIPLVALTSTDERIEHACANANGFIYCVGQIGVTGARNTLATGLRSLVDRIRGHTELPILVGFGISRREHVETVAGFADGVVVASALLDEVGRAPEGQAAACAGTFVARLKGRTE